MCVCVCVRTQAMATSFGSYGQVDVSSYPRDSTKDLRVDWCLYLALLQSP